MMDDKKGVKYRVWVFRGSLVEKVLIDAFKQAGLELKEAGA